MLEELLSLLREFWEALLDERGPQTSLAQGTDRALLALPGPLSQLSTVCCRQPASPSGAQSPVLGGKGECS